MKDGSIGDPEACDAIYYTAHVDFCLGDGRHAVGTAPICLIKRGIGHTISAALLCEVRTTGFDICVEKINISCTAQSSNPAMISNNLLLELDGWCVLPERSEGNFKRALCSISRLVSKLRTLLGPGRANVRFRSQRASLLPPPDPSIILDALGLYYDRSSSL